jgi:hypothetical protein
MAYQVGPALEALKLLGFNAKDWLVKLAKSKTMWFASAVTIFGAAETYLPQMQGLIPSEWYGPLFTGVGVVAALLRFVTTEALSDK